MSYLHDAERDFQKAFMHLKEEYARLQVGRASSALVDGLNIDAYGMSQPLKAVASVMVPDSKTLSIQPWDKSMLAAIEKAIQNSDLNLNPVNNGVSIILNIPSLTEERRRDLLKVVNRLAEEAKISVRNARHECLSALKRAEHESDISEDERKRFEKSLQDKVDLMNIEIAQAAKVKEESIMTF